MDDVIIIGAGIGGLTLALALDRAGVGCRIYEAAPQIAPLGVGVNLLPHATEVLAGLGVLEDLAAISVRTRESVFFNRFGQLIFSEPAGEYAGNRYPQLSVHRADLHQVLLAAVQRRLGRDRLTLGTRCVGFRTEQTRVFAQLSDTIGAAPSGEVDGEVGGSVLIGCDGVHSAIRRQLFPEEGEPRFSGVTMWRGVTRWSPFLSGASMVRAGWLATGKLVLYPIRNDVDGAGTQLVNWVAELESGTAKTRDWGRPGDLADFAPRFADWTFDWLDVPALLAAADQVLEYPMVDQDPLPRWTFGRVTLLGDAAHPMVPRGSNGAGQAILDAQVLADRLAAGKAPERALEEYDAVRRPATSQVVLANRADPPDAILREVYERTGDRPFERIDDVISRDELRGIADRYRFVTAGAGGGFS